MEYKQGTFRYSGFGTGVYYSANGPMVVTHHDAKRIAESEGVDCILVDTLPQSSGYNPVTEQQQRVETQRAARLNSAMVPDPGDIVTDPCF